MKASRYEIDVEAFLRDYGGFECDTEIRALHADHVRDMIALAAACGRSIWERRRTDTVPINGTILVFRPDGKVLQCLVDWTGKHRLRAEVDASISEKEARSLLAASAE